MGTGVNNLSVPSGSTEAEDHLSSSTELGTTSATLLIDETEMPFGLEQYEPDTTEASSDPSCNGYLNVDVQMKRVGRSFRPASDTSPLVSQEIIEVPTGRGEDVLAALLDLDDCSLDLRRIEPGFASPDFFTSELGGYRFNVGEDDLGVSAVVVSYRIDDIITTMSLIDDRDTIEARFHELESALSRSFDARSGP